MPFQHTCTKSDCYCCNKKIFSYGENKKKFEIKNPKEIYICQYLIDGCVIPGSDTLKCDCAYTIYENDVINKIIFVEFKGTDIAHAAQQIITTYNLFKNKIKALKPSPTVEAFIIHSRSPSATQSEYLKFKKILNKENISLQQVRLSYSYQL